MLIENGEFEEKYYTKTKKKYQPWNSIYCEFWPVFLRKWLVGFSQPQIFVFISKWLYLFLSKQMEKKKTE